MWYLAIRKKDNTLQDGVMLDEKVLIDCPKIYQAPSEHTFDCCCLQVLLLLISRCCIQQAMCVMDPLYWNEKNASIADQPVYLEASCLDAKGKAFSGAL